ncbi:MAG TPA: formyltransferase family protein [Vicinamibacterales bacterium]|nr:formyltransferase family protein [Vicinamibacterales bacterium]
MAEPHPVFAFAGDRDVAVNVLALLLERGDAPSALVLPDEGDASHDEALVDLCLQAGVRPPVIRARQLHEGASIDRLRALGLEYLVCVHFPCILRRPVLAVAAGGVLNLHPAYLPYNRGWHTPTWTILDGTPAGATLHFMSEALDAGDIVHQEQIPVDPSDTADTLYQKLKALEVCVFRAGWRQLVEGRVRRVPQAGDVATTHRRRDLFDPALQRIDLDAPTQAAELLRRLRALTTNRLDEAAYFERDGRRYRVQVSITPDDPAPPPQPRAVAAVAGER